MKITMGEQGGAIISKDGVYRYLLTRTWDEPWNIVCWVMLNPSTADADQDDRTIRRCIGFSKRLGHTSMRVVNLFAYRATDPDELGPAKDPVGPENARIVGEAVGNAQRVIVAFGGLSNKMWAKAKPIVNVIKKEAKSLECLGKTKSGAPRHPLYLPGDRKLVMWP